MFKIKRIGDVVFSEWGHDCDCENCPMGWDVYSYEGECEDCGCCFDYHFNVPLWKCMLPHWVKELIKRIKKWNV